MSGARTLVASLPDGAQLPALFVKELVAEIDTARITLAVQREDTLQLYRVLATRNFLRGAALPQPSEEADAIFGHEPDGDSEEKRGAW